MTNTTNTNKGFFVNVYRADGSASYSSYFRTENKAKAHANRMSKCYGKNDPNHVVKVEKHRAK